MNPQITMRLRSAKIMFIIYETLNLYDDNADKKYYNIKYLIS